VDFIFFKGTRLEGAADRSLRFIRKRFFGLLGQLDSRRVLVAATVLQRDQFFDFFHSWRATAAPTAATLANAVEKSPKKEEAVQAERRVGYVPLPVMHAVQDFFELHDFFLAILKCATRAGSLGGCLNTTVA